MVNGFTEVGGLPQLSCTVVVPSQIIPVFWVREATVSSDRPPSLSGFPSVDTQVIVL
jgi:hypothetical protein